MNPKSLNLIKEIDRLWEPVFPYLAQYIQELYQRKDGNILEIGPFSGVIFALQRENIGDFFLIAAFPPGMGNFFKQEAKKQKQEDKINVIESNPSLTGIRENTINLAIFRGAFFFPSLGEANLLEIYRILKPDGVAFVGGGFGKYTPDAVIKEIGKRSRELNLKLGKIHIDRNDLQRDLQSIEVKGKIELISEGGLWILMKK